jgi:hypothetical protein
MGLLEWIGFKEELLGLTASRVELLVLTGFKVGGELFEWIN